MRSMRVHLLGICPADLGALSRLASAQDIPFPLLSDPTRQISGLYGMYDDDTEQVQSGIVLLDPQGIVRMAVPVSRLQPEEVLALVQRVVPQPAAMTLTPSPGR
jgi:peroxiredoxin